MAETAKIGKDSVVTFEYTLRDEAGETIDSSEGGEPMCYLHGNEQLVPGLERALEGQSTGFSGKISVAPADGYGEHHKEMVLTVPRSEFEFEPEEGQQIGAYDEHGREVPFLVTSVSQSEVVLDGNHPLAGKTLHFDVKVVEVRPATEEELQHGHGHAHGGCSGCGEEEMSACGSQGCNCCGEEE